ncbi:MAG: DEAD/DEAH box helicase [Firmicutes bacterium]|nr:DEAD/DEAH box helicase [Bacillota bacterium]
MEARTHLLVWRDATEGSVHELVAVGLLDLDQSTRALSARILKGQRTDVFASTRDYEPFVRLQAKKQHHRFVARPLSKKLTHLLMLPKAAVDDVLEDDTPRILLHPQGGAIEALFLRRFANDFHLPYLAEWSKPIWDTCRERGLVSELSVWTDPRVEAWRGCQAYDLRMTETEAVSLVSELLATGVLVLPEGITEAPSLRDTLQADDHGDYRVLDYLQTYAPHLATTVEALAKPSHDLDRPIDPAMATMARTPFPAQAHTAQAILTGLSQQKGVFCSSDMGTGKSILSLAVAHALSQRTKRGCAVLLLVPGITVPKWVRDEIGRTLPEAPTRVLDSWRDLVRYRNTSVRRGQKAPLEFHLLSRDTAKLGMPKAPALVYRARMAVSNPASYESAPTKGRILSDVFVCPDCGGIQRKVEKHETLPSRAMDFETLQEAKLGFADLASGWVDVTHPKAGSTVFLNHHQPTTQRPKFLKSVTEYHCSECGHNLMRFLVPERENVSGLRTRRLAPATFIQQHLKGWYDLVIVDELHQFKNASGQGEAMGAIVGAAKKVLGLTGTLSDGKASSLYHLLWRIAPGKMLEDGFHPRSLNAFVRRYGTMEQRGRFDQDDVKVGGSMTERRVILNPPKEVPGLSPRLFVQHLADQCVFLELGDLGLPLVELEERPVFVAMDPEQEAAYNAFHIDLEAEMKRQYALGNSRAFASFIPAVVNAANQPYQSQTVWLSDDACVSFQATSSETEWTPKERQLVSDVQAELAQGRRCVVYVRYSGEAKQDKRLTQVLQQAGIRAETLSASVAPEERVAWLERSLERGVDVVVCNAKLVEVGLDLLSHPSLFFYQFTDEIATMRQAARRAWRIGQHRQCKVFYYVYQGTYEMAQLSRMLAKRSHAMLLEGRLDRSEVAAFTATDGQSASTYAIAHCLCDVADLSSQWMAMADKDIPQGVTMLAEAEFQVEIGRAMQRLGQETKRLAGVVDAVMLAEPVPQAPAVLVEAVLPQDTRVTEAVTLGEWKKRLPSQAKKVLKKQGVSDDQLLLFAL